MSERFGFGKNWKQFLETMNEERRKEAIKSLSEWLDTDDLSGCSFLDIGSGSGLFSLAARDMGALVHSFDYDQDCVECTMLMRSRYYPEDKMWTVERGDVLDNKYLSKYELQDIVYSWGVLHHTGNMYSALRNSGDLVKAGGLLYIAIYNDQGFLSSFWKAEKILYNKMPLVIKTTISIVSFMVLWFVRSVWDFAKLRPFESFRIYRKKRGMSPWYDVVDWMGGYPFEVAKPEEILDFYRAGGFELIKMQTAGGSNRCNQFVFRKKQELENDEQPMSKTYY